MSASTQGFDVHPVAPAIGAEICGFDLAAPISDTLRAELRRTWLAHGVIFFRDQSLDADQLLALARLFGEPAPYPLLPGIEGYPEITEILKRPEQRENFGGIWHSDTTYLDEPPMATLLIAREVPPAGGDTQWASMTAAYDALSPGMQRMLDGLVAVNTSALAAVSKTREDALRAHGSLPPPERQARHPVVRTHPETGRRALYLSQAHTARFDGFTDAESAPLIEYLTRHATRPEFTCRFRWTPGSIALWDNRCTMHYPLNDYHGHRRLMHRITLRGDRPR